MKGRDPWTDPLHAMHDPTFVSAPQRCDRPCMRSTQSPINMDLRSYRVCTAVVVCIRRGSKLAFILHASMPEESKPSARSESNPVLILPLRIRTKTYLRFSVARLQGVRLVGLPKEHCSFLCNCERIHDSVVYAIVIDCYTGPYPTPETY